MCVATLYYAYCVHSVIFLIECTAYTPSRFESFTAVGLESGVKEHLWVRRTSFSELYVLMIDDDLSQHTGCETPTTMPDTPSECVLANCRLVYRSATIEKEQNYIGEFNVSNYIVFYNYVLIWQ